jgi:signal transduction histidine kinase
MNISHDLLRSRDAETARIILSRIAHDLNNYLYAISGTAALSLESAGKGEPVRSDLEEILEVSNRMADYIRRIQAIAHGGDDDRQAESLKGIVTGIERYIRREYPERISIRTELPGKDCYAPATRKMIENAIINICCNACESISGRGEVVLTLGTAVKVREGAEEKFCRITVEDNGRGMDDEEVKNCRQIFYTTADGGTDSLGIGLTVAEGIIRKHRGELLISSSPGEGTTVEILLPLQ